jgi:hypothetical protein
MIEIRLFDKDINEIFDIVHDLKKRGLVSHKDFDFTYIPSEDIYTENDYHNGITIPKSVIFTFYKKSIASWFALKYL